MTEIVNRICKRCGGRVTVDEVEVEDGSKERFVSCTKEACFSFQANGDKAALLLELEHWTRVVEPTPDESVAVSHAPVSGPPATAQPAKPRIPHDTRDDDLEEMYRRAAATDPSFRAYLTGREGAGRRAEARRRARETRHELRRSRS